MKNILPSFLSLVFRICLIFLIVFVWARYYIDSLYMSVAVTILVTIMIDVLIRLFVLKRQNILSLKKTELEKIEKINNTFLFGDDKQTLDFFYKLIQTKHECVKKRDYILVEYDNGEKIVLMPFYTYRKTSIDDLIFIINKIKNTNPTKLVVCCNEAEPSIFKFIEKLSLEILILDKNESYLRLLKEYDYYPNNLIELKPTQKNTIRSMIAYSLNKQRTKGYFFTSCIILLMSFFVRFNIYYVVFSSLLLILSLISYLNPRFNKKIPNKIF